MINVVFFSLSILIIIILDWDNARRYGVYEKKIYALMFEIAKGLSFMSMGFFIVQMLKYFIGQPTLL